MRLCSFALAVAAAVALFAGTASAQNYVSAGVGSTDAGSTNAYNLSPSGTAVDLRAGHVFFDNDFSVAVEVGAMFGEVAAEKVIQTCTVGICGYDEFDHEHRKLDWSGSLGLKVGHDVGPVQAFVTGGVRIAQVTEGSRWDSGGAYPSGSYEQTTYAAGPYYGAGISYPLKGRLSATLIYERANLTRMSWNSTWGSGDTGYQQETWTAGVRWTFGKK